MFINQAETTSEQLITVFCTFIYLKKMNLMRVNKIFWKFRFNKKLLNPRLIVFGINKQDETLHCDSAAGAAALL